MEGKISSLLEISKIRIDDFSKIDFTKEHDHLVYWQNSCEKILRTEFNILPDDALSRFLISDAGKKEDRFHQKYSRKFGLPKLSNEKSKKREDALLKYKNLPSKGLNEEISKNKEVLKHNYKRAKENSLKNSRDISVCLLHDFKMNNVLWYLSDEDEWNIVIMNSNRFGVTVNISCSLWQIKPLNSWSEDKSALHMLKNNTFPSSMIKEALIEKELEWNSKYKNNFL